MAFFLFCVLFFLVEQNYTLRQILLNSADHRVRNIHFLQIRCIFSRQLNAESACGIGKTGGFGGADDGRSNAFFPILFFLIIISFDNCLRHPNTVCRRRHNAARIACALAAGI